MRILHVNKFFDLNGGAEVYMHELMKRQEKAGHDVHALSTRDQKNLPSQDRSRFVARRDLSKSAGIQNDVGIAMNYLWNREAKSAMELALDEIRPDVVHLHNIYHHLSTSILEPIRERGVRCVQTLHDLKLACPNYRMYTEGSLCERCKGGKYLEAVKHKCISASFLPNMLAALEMGMTKSKQSYERTVHRFICPSEFMSKKMVEWGESASKFEIVRMPAPRFEKAPRGGGYALAIGRLAEDKGFDELIRASAEVPHLPIKIAGRGPMESSLRALIQNLGAHHVELVGFVRGDELVELHRNADVYLATPRGYENAPLTVTDAIAYGLPVIGYEIGGIPEMVDHGENGFLVPHGDRDALVRSLKIFASLTAEEHDRMATASYELSRTKFPDWDEHLSLIEKVYRD
ncbi:MAG: glycosyltransferase [bacterium]|nr:glycosyltransferase [bacterium]